MRRVLFAAALAAGVLLARGRDPRGADDAGDAARRAVVVAQIGPTAHHHRRRARGPPRRTCPRSSAPPSASDPATVRRAFLEQVLVPEALESLGADGEKLDQQLPTSYALERARSQSVVRAIRARLGPESAIPMEDVQKYYDENRDALRHAGALPDLAHPLQNEGGGAERPRRGEEGADAQGVRRARARAQHRQGEQPARGQPRVHLPRRHVERAWAARRRGPRAGRAGRARRRDRPRARRRGRALLRRLAQGAQSPRPSAPSTRSRRRSATPCGRRA